MKYVCVLPLVRGTAGPSWLDNSKGSQPTPLALVSHIFFLLLFPYHLLYLFFFPSPSVLYPLSPLLDFLVFFFFFSFSFPFLFFSYIICLSFTSVQLCTSSYLTLFPYLCLSLISSPLFFDPHFTFSCRSSLPSPHFLPMFCSSIYSTPLLPTLDLSISSQLPPSSPLFSSLPPLFHSLLFLTFPFPPPSALTPPPLRLPYLLSSPAPRQLFLLLLLRL